MTGKEGMYNQNDIHDATNIKGRRARERGELVQYTATLLSPVHGEKLYLSICN